MIVVPCDHATQRDVVLAKCGGIGWPPPVRHIGHDEHAQSIGPIEFARRLDLYMLSEAVQPDLPRA